MSSKLFAIACAAGLLGMAGAASAQDAKDKKIDPNELVQKLVARANGLEKKFDKLDTNHDGAVDRSEVDAAAKKAFSRLDKNGDGVIDKDELARSKEKIAAKRGDKAADMAVRRFEKADANHDGKLTQEEFLAAIPDWFERADTNHDGKVTKEEIAAAAIKIRDKAEKKAGADEKSTTAGKSDKEKAEDKPKTDDKVDQSDDEDDDMSDKGDGSKK